MLMQASERLDATPSGMRASLRSMLRRSCRNGAAERQLLQPALLDS